MKVAQDLELDDTFIYMDAEKGWKLSHYIENAQVLDYHNEDEVRCVLKMLRKLHDTNIKSPYDFDVWNKILDFIKRASEKGRNDFAGFQSLYDKIEQIYQLTKNDKVEKRLCHGACYDSNILIGIDNKMNLIDWEYSGNCDPANDLGTFICCSDYTYEEAVRVLEIYFERELTEEELRHYIAYIAIAAYYWFVWAIYQECLGNIVDKYVYMWYKYSKFYSEKALELYKD